MMQAGSFEEERSLGEGIELGDSSLTISTNKTYNAAKCSGANQDHRRLTGTLNCSDAPGWIGSPRIEKENPQHCPDNLSAGAVWACASGDSVVGQAYCQRLHQVSAVARVTRTAPDQNSANPNSCQGVTSKLEVAHPHQASRNAGVIAFKRVKCDSAVPPTCAVYKVVECIKIPNHKTFQFTFSSVKESDATDKELMVFAELVTKKAWDNPGTATASIKRGWSCTGRDKIIAEGWARAF